MTQMQWTDATEKRPPVGADLLITISTSKVVIGGYYGPDIGWDWAETDDARDTEAEVTHWMLFPPPAKP